MTATGLLDPSALNPNTSASTRSVSNDELASAQMEKITGKDSVMRQRAETSGKNYSTSRGLLDSSIGAAATFGAFVDRAAPIAMADADRYGAVADQNLSYENQFKMSDKNFAQQGLLQKDNQAWQTGERTGAQTFASGENAQDRTLQRDLQTGDQAWRSGENAADRTLTISQNEADRGHQTQILDKQQNFASAENALDRTLSREEIESRERTAVEQSKAEIEKLGYSLQLDQMQLNASTQNQIQMSLLQQIMAIQSDGNLDPTSKEGAIANAMAAATNMAKTIADAMKTPTTPAAPQTFNAERASTVMVDEAAKMGFTNPNMAELNMALEYAKTNNLTEQQMRAYVRDTLKQPATTPAPSPTPTPSPVQTPPAAAPTPTPAQPAPSQPAPAANAGLIDLAAQYGYSATPEEAAAVAAYAAANGLSAEEVVMAELRARGLA